MYNIFEYIFLDKNISHDLLYPVFNIHLFLLGTIIEGIVSQILYLGPIFDFV